jgi:hypothetical protein
LHFFRNALYLHKTLLVMLITDDPKKEKDVIKYRMRLFVCFFSFLFLFWLLAVVALAVIQGY